MYVTADGVYVTAEGVFVTADVVYVTADGVYVTADGVYFIIDSVYVTGVEATFSAAWTPPQVQQPQTQGMEGYPELAQAHPDRTLHHPTPQPPLLGVGGGVATWTLQRQEPPLSRSLRILMP
jgi:hypothetical protein